MAISYLTGFEMGSLAAEGVVGGTVTAAAGLGRNGGYVYQNAWSASLGTASDGVTLANSTGTGTGRASFKSIAFWMKWTLTGSNRSNQIFRLVGGGTASVDRYVIQAQYVTGDVFYLTVSSNGVSYLTGFGSPTGATQYPNRFTPGVWHSVELDVGYNAGTGVRLYVDGVLISSNPTSPAVSPVTTQIIGTGALLFADTGSMLIDDMVCFDDTSGGFSATNPEWRINNLLPTSDSIVGTGWTDEGGGATALFEGANNVPPIGSTATTGDNRIKNATSTTTGTYAATLAAYSTITGLTATSQVLAVAPVADTAREITTGDPKPGALTLTAQPDQSTTPGEQAFSYGYSGSTIGVVMGTHPTGWQACQGPVTTAPAITAVSSTPVIRVKKNLASTRVVDVDYLAAAVLWAVPTAPAVLPPHNIHTPNPAISPSFIR